jgi:hypothetical protein
MIEFDKDVKHEDSDIGILTSMWLKHMYNIILV